MLVSIEELGKTSLYPEIISQITRGDSKAAELQITAAEEYVKSYLFKYDLNAAFGSETEPPTHPSEFVKKAVKIVASYYLVRLANPNVNIELFRADFEDVTVLLEAVRDGKNNLNLPYAPDTGASSDDGVDWDSNPKRTNFF